MIWFDDKWYEETRTKYDVMKTWLKVLDDHLLLYRSKRIIQCNVNNLHDMMYMGYDMYI